MFPSDFLSGRKRFVKNTLKLEYNARIDVVTNIFGKELCHLPTKTYSDAFSELFQTPPVQQYEAIKL